MDRHTFFSLTVHYTKNQKLAEQLLPVARKFLSDPAKLTNCWNYKNTYTEDEGLATELELRFFVDIILKTAQEYLADKSIKLKKNVNLWVSIFASEMQQGDYHHPHSHPGALLSGLIYLQVPSGSSNLEFSSPRGKNIAWLDFVEQSPLPQDLFSIDHTHTISIKPEPGLFLFWESWASHRVPTNNSTEPRITMVFNVGAEYENV